VYFNKLKINHWQQFEAVDLDIHDRLTILTGSNGSGKTTLLNLFAKHHFGWQSVSLATPKPEKGTGIMKFFSRLFGGEDKSNEKIIGEIEYSNHIKANLVMQDGGGAQYNIGIQQQQPVKCFFIPSHRPVFRYEQIGNIPTAKKNKDSAFQEVYQTNRQRYFGGGNQQSSSFLMKNTLIGWAINGYGVQGYNNSYIMPPDSEQIQHFEGFQAVLRKVLPKTLGFEKLEIRSMEIVFICNESNDEFLLETASGGISALIDISWQIYMFATKENSDFTVIIDEVENHLHPIMQRSILQDLINAFPTARFIVSTHSPLIIGSVKESAVYALIYNENKKINSRYLDLVNKPKTAAEILDEVLGVSFTMPVWIEDKLNQLINKFSIGEMTKERFSELRIEMNQLGLEKMVPYAIEQVMVLRND
jgi:hypothetical protein